MKTLMAIGGALDVEEPFIFKEFIRRAGGKRSKIVVLPQASGLKNTGKEYAEIFQRLGAISKSLEFRERIQVDRKHHLDALRNATGVFLAGGTQLRITTIIGGTEFEKELLAAYHRGAIICGTSAGTAVMSKVMITHGRSGSTPREGLARFSPGIGFTDKILFDQHFRQKDRLGRLAYAVSMQPGVLGIGIDENTCAIVENDKRISVIGKNAVTIVDGKNIQSTNAAEVEASHPVAVSGLTMHVLTEGCSFDMQKRQAAIPKSKLE